MNPDRLLALARHSLGCYGIANYTSFELPPHLEIVATKLEEARRPQNPIEVAQDEGKASPQASFSCVC